MPTAPDLLSSLWNRACAEEIGIKVKVNKDREQFRRELYDHRRANPQEEKWMEIMLFCPNDGKVWFVKKATEMPE